MSNKLPVGMGLLAMLIGLSAGCCGLRNCNTGCGPFANIGGRLACSGGCGDVYVDEYINHPPVVDPCGSCDTGCDSCGGCGSCGSCEANFTGTACQPHRPLLERLAVLWGVPYSPANCGNCGVSTCQSCRGGCSTCERGAGPAYPHAGGMSVPSSGCNCTASTESSIHSSHSGMVQATEMRTGFAQAPGYGGALKPFPHTMASSNVFQKESGVPFVQTAAPRKSEVATKNRPKSRPQLASVAKPTRTAASRNVPETESVQAQYQAEAPVKLKTIPSDRSSSRLVVVPSEE